MVYFNVLADRNLRGLALLINSGGISAPTPFSLPVTLGVTIQNSKRELGIIRDCTTIRDCKRLSLSFRDYYIEFMKDYKRLQETTTDCRWQSQTPTDYRDCYRLWEAMRGYYIMGYFP